MTCTLKGVLEVSKYERTFSPIGYAEETARSKLVTR